MTNEKKISKPFIEKIPKTDLHLHLDGSLRIPTLIELAHKEKVKLPSYEEEGLKELVFKDRYENLGEYLQGFMYTVGVMQRLENIERVAFELAEDCYKEGVRYIEVRFAPQLHISKISEVKEVALAVTHGLDRAKRGFNQSVAVDDMAFEYGIILCAMRNFNEHMSPYFAQLMACEKNQGRSVYATASFELVQEAVKLRDMGAPVVAFDLAGEEAGYPSVHHKKAFQYAHKNFLRKTVHAGEAYGPESIFQAITECYANRIGHGTLLYEQSEIRNRAVENTSIYVERLSEYIANQRITMEVCPTSNMQTIPSIKTLKDHPLRHMVKHNLAVSINTDNRLVSNTSVTHELEMVATHLNTSHREFRNIALAGFKGSFFPGSYAEKRKYVRRAINLYEGLARLYLEE